MALHGLFRCRNKQPEIAPYFKRNLSLVSICFKSPQAFNWPCYARGHYNLRGLWSSKMHRPQIHLLLTITYTLHYYEVY